MVRHRASLSIVCLGFVVWIASIAPALATLHVVLLFDERPELPGLAALDAEFVRTITKKSTERVEIFREELDSSRFGRDYQSLLRDFLRAKYTGKKIDAVVAVFGPALEFLLEYGNEIFPDSFIIFCGLDKVELEGRALPANVRGMLLKREFAPTLELALDLHPQTKHAFVVAGTSDFDRRLLEQARREFEPYRDRVAITYVTSLPMQQLLVDLKQLPMNSIVLFTTLFQDGNGEPFVPHEVVPLVSSAASAPLYGFVDQYLGRGIIGGKLYGPSAQGAGVAELVLQSLAGTVQQDAKVVEPPPTGWQFDWRQLQRWGIAESRLPPGSAIQFRNPNIWDQYKIPILGILTALILQSTLIAWLIYEHGRRSAAEVQSRNAMAELAHLNRLETAGQLSASIAHEINQPVTGIVLKASTALRWLAAENPDTTKVRDILTDIVSAAQRAGDIITGVRAMFKKDFNSKTVLNLNNLIKLVLALVQLDLQRDGVRVETQLDENLLAVDGDAVQLQQVILNLIVNAADAMRTVEPRILRIRSNQTLSGLMRISIEDSGPGISAPDMDRIFTPLFTTKAGGMGMGLSICRSIIENHGGKIWVAAAESRGANFQFELPAARNTRGSPMTRGPQ